MMINPSLSSHVEAIEVGDGGGRSVNNDFTDANNNDNNNNNIATNVNTNASVTGANEGFINKESSKASGEGLDQADLAPDDVNQMMMANTYNASNPDAGIMTTSTITSASTSPVTTFSIGGAGVNETVETSVDTVAYRSHTVSIGISNADDYYLMISGDPNLNLAGGSASLTGITGSNVTGSNIPAGQWGYSWDYTNTKTNEAMVYSAVPVGAYKLAQPSLTNNAVSFTGKLNFAAKFANNSVLGSYSSNVILTLVVTPKANTGNATWRDATGKETAYEAGTSTMQGIKDVSHGADGGFCKNNSKIGEGWTVDLQDNRGTNPVTYTIVKLNGNCWMGQNLSLTGPLVLTSADSDVSSSWTLPASVTSWVGDNSLAQVRTGIAELANWKRGYGNYYSWPAATAGSGDTSVTSGDAAASICPRGWRLPPNSGDGSYSNLSGLYRSNWLTDQTINNTSGINGYRFGLDSTTVYKQANFWPAAGYIYDASATIGGSGSDGFYWSRTALASNNANGFVFSRVGLDASRSNGRWFGYTVRCVASY